MKQVLIFFCIFFCHVVLADTPMHEIKRVINVLQGGHQKSPALTSDDTYQKPYNSCYLQHDKKIRYGVIAKSNTRDTCYILDNNGDLIAHIHYHELFSTLLELKKYHKSHYNDMGYNDGVWKWYNNSLCYFSYAYGAYNACIEPINNRRDTRVKRENTYLEATNSSINPTFNPDDDHLSPVERSIVGVSIGALLIFGPVVFVCCVKYCIKYCTTKRGYQKVR